MNTHPLSSKSVGTLFIIIIFFLLNGCLLRAVVSTTSGKKTFVAIHTQESGRALLSYCTTTKTQIHTTHTHNVSLEGQPSLLLCTAASEAAFFWLQPLKQTVMSSRLLLGK